jgi:cobalt-zinc-cadmium efflux system membrane fusion protein
MKIIKIVYILFIFLSGFALCSCGDKEKTTVTEAGADHTEEEDENQVELTPEQFKNAGVELGKIEQKQISGTIKVNGILDVPPQQLVTISVPLGGFLKNTSMLEGTRVRKGQVIAIIENLEFIQIQQDYLEAKSQLEQAKADYDRQLELAKENVNSQKTVQQAKTAYETWKAKAGGLREKLNVIHVDVSALEKGEMKSSINLYAPIDGYVTEVNGNIGKFMNPSDVLFEIVDTEHLHAELIVFEKDVPKLKIGQKVRFTLANESTERMATVFLIGREIGTDRTVQIHCHIDKEDTELLPGMYLSALVETSGALVSALPNEAIVDHQGRKYIFVLSGKAEQPAAEGRHFTMVEVQTLSSELGFTEVAVPDSFARAEIVVKGAYSILSEMKNSEEGEEHGH